LAVHVAKECPSMVDALCVIDVVEGREMEGEGKIVFDIWIFR
jgi:hypothetical protein